ncbi:MAG: FkbM family methyltransferase [Gomphosphaeria aponina SAG 52.96 = DSM 107014]|uniref:FkbM family methyltransferase n=1 Tax=Gomphosphaeria aponina SAG 52.96 = DSM 107014 TaxID=1521640 RepID=A0A941GVN0_9CHRO|nr:FkbM family methyltransferase [Gomphosphaeria aponina SAG 52.96 = DSM 107014]
MSGIIRPIIVEPLKHIYNMVRNRDYFTYSKLCSQIGRVPRYHDCKIKLNGWDLLIPDSKSFLGSYKEIFLERIYEVRSDKKEKKILDLGSNVGLSVLFFKHIYPEAEIIAIEADPKIFKYLEKNVYGNGYNDVKLVNKAVWHENTIVNFVSEGADAGHIAEGEEPNIIQIQAVDIGEILQNSEFDLVKMDIEGSEEFVLPRCEGFLEKINYIFIEYHSKVGRKQCLNQILGILSEADFRVNISNVMHNHSGFCHAKAPAGFDMQLNIFAWKDQHENMLG